MKILYHHRTLGDGAEGIHIAEMVNAFRGIGCQVQVVAPVGERCNLSEQKETWLSIIKSYIPGFFFELLEIGYNLYGFILLCSVILRNRPDFIYDRYITFNAAPVLAGKLFGIPVFLEVNAPLALERFEQKDEKLYLHRTAFFLEKWICSNAFKTIVVSTPLKKYLVSQGVPDAMIEVMANGVDIQKFSPLPKDNSLLDSYDFSRSSIVVGFVGILRPWHGIDVLLEAFSLAYKSNNSLRLLIVGDGNIRKEIEAQIVDLGLENKVVITGVVPHGEVSRYIALFDFAVSPKATFYASPMKIVEYMAQQKVVLAPRMENIMDIITDGVDGKLFDPDSPSSLARCITSLVNKNDELDFLAANARKKTREVLNWQRNAEKILTLFSNNLQGWGVSNL